MTAAQNQLIREFFDCAEKLQAAGVVRSDKILGDIGEWLCVEHYGLKLAESGRHPGFDGHIGKKRVQVKTHNSSTRTNLSVGQPHEYDELIIIIGPKSRLRIDTTTTSDQNSFHAYRFRSNEVERLMRRTSGFYCCRATLQDRQYKSHPF